MRFFDVQHAPNQVKLLAVRPLLDLDTDLQIRILSTGPLIISASRSHSVVLEIGKKNRFRFCNY